MMTTVAWPLPMLSSPARMARARSSVMPMATDDAEVPLSAVHEYKIMTCPGFLAPHGLGTLAALTVSDASSRLGHSSNLD